MTDAPLPRLSVHAFRRTDNGALLGVGSINIGDHLRLKGVKLIHAPSGPKVHAPSVRKADQTGWQYFASFTPALTNELTRLLMAEYVVRPAPGERAAPCRQCGTMVTFERGISYDDDGAHRCAA